jgi:hypothetical protein
MGISTASLVGSPLIKTLKRGQTTPVSPEQVRSSQELFNHGVIGDRGLTEAMQSASKTISNISPHDSSIIDIFRGEEQSNFDKVDVGKVQMFLFTLIVVIVYITALIKLLQIPKFDSLPVVDPSMIALLGISHVGYLTNKAIPK